MIPNLNTVEYRIGDDLDLPFRWAQPVNSYCEVTGATQAAPAVITAVDHGLPEGWPFTLTGALGMPEINAPYPNKPHFARVLSSEAIELNEVNTANAQPYLGGGVICYRKPISLEGMTAEASLVWPNGEASALELPAPNIDPVSSVITAVIANNQSGLAPGFAELRVRATDTAGKTRTVGRLLLEIVE